MLKSKSLKKKQKDYKDRLNNGIVDMFKTSFRLFYKNPGQTLFLAKTLFRQKKAVATRQKWKEKGTYVPPFMILSITNKCNLKCKGCYAKIHHHNRQESEMNEKTLRRILTEAKELGISIILVAGGEPFVRKDIIPVLQDYPEIIFPVFTNGLLLNETMLKKLKKAKNIIPIISLEGKKAETDNRRGTGVYNKLEGILDQLSKAGILNGISFTLTRTNFDTVLDYDFISHLIKKRSQIFFFVEYVPVEEGTEWLTLTKEQRFKLKEKVEKYRSEFPALFISFPGDEEEFGGCLAAGRGFIHINPLGNIEPCPFAPYSDINLNNLSLHEGLKSDLLEKIRSNKEILEESPGKGGCTLWNKKDVVKSLLEEDKVLKEKMKEVK